MVSGGLDCGVVDSLTNHTMSNEVAFTETLYLILTDSGKPVYHSSGTENEISRYAAVIQAIVSCFAEDEDLQSFSSKNAFFVVLKARPLLLVAVDKAQKSEAQLRAHLYLLRAQILSVLTNKQLQKQIELRPGLDLRPLLGGTNVFLNALTTQFRLSSPWNWLNALESLALKRSVRSALNTALLDARANSSVLYGLIACDGLFCGVVRPRQHSLHPPDLHLVFNMLYNTTVFNEGEHWAPICFPKFNPNGFLYAYIRALNPRVFIVLVSPDKNGFYEVQNAANSLVNQIEPALINKIDESCKPGKVNCSLINVSPIVYFVYKSNLHVQFFCSACETDEPVTSLNLLFAQLQARMQRRSQRVCWYTRNDASVIGWSSPNFEVYCYANCTDREVVSHAVRKLVAWVNANKARLFIVDGAVF